MFRLTSLGVSVIAAYAIIMFVGAQGAGPMGLLLVLGWNSSFVIPVASGWAGIILLVLGLLLKSRPHLDIAFILAFLSLFVSWAGILLGSEEMLVTLLSSIPFVLISSWFGVRSFQYVGSLDGNS